ncbi:putative bifunctional diguanylate cyclase/phosphodiesterase [Shewanella gelidii]|uniref:GGDEF domain-containing protein n=1 Tax=Shewanella gelidii TaxID=1642821 RepID=A0A917JPP9_9GAMM|nr:GGDEF domain-containing phosphodiesterase [Shewanella gelidii]MCL1097776.1 GGDEF domain-containing phosphodiesterase [Shewanella gelidii]GGI78825.1 hypothetical protein GCM10009332_15320 [Shewanella gelidii]
MAKFIDATKAFQCNVRKSPISSAKPGFDELFQNVEIDSDSANQVIKSSLRAESLLRLSKVIGSYKSLYADLENIYRTIRFSVDLENCILVRSLNHNQWEYLHFIKGYQLQVGAEWVQVDSNQSYGIDELLNMPKEILCTFPTSNFDNSVLDQLLTQKSSYFEHFVHNKGGVIYATGADLNYSHCDMCYLSHVTSIISYCVEKEISDDFLAQVYRNLGSAAAVGDRLKSEGEKQVVIPAIYMDTPTGLPNQRGFLRILRQAIEVKSKAIFVVILSIDNFNYFCGLFDDSVQQRFIKAAIDKIREVVTNETISYLGGSKFAFFLSDTHVAEVNMLLQQVVDRFAVDIVVTDYRANFNILAGYVNYSREQVTQQNPKEQAADLLLKLAEIALFQARKNRQINFLGYEAGMDDELKLKIDLMRSLSQAISNEEFELYFQPIVAADDAAHGRYYYFEALLRWQHPAYGLVGPDKFIHIAEKSGDIVALGYWVVERVCRYLAESNLEASIRVAVNLSPVQLREDNLVNNLIHIVERHGIAAESIVFEITETAAMQNAELSKIQFAKLREYGFKLAVDDFGTGHSALSYLLEFSLDILKIDKSFIDQTQDNQRYELIAESMIILAHQLSMTVVCEGIETPQQLKMVQDWQSDFIQGYFICKPKPWHYFVDKLKNIGSSNNLKEFKN